ncbi:uncharacterized protein EI97DRAFT_481531, partial [Westerdykella ornata]
AIASCIDIQLEENLDRGYSTSLSAPLHTLNLSLQKARFQHGLSDTPQNDPTITNAVPIAHNRELPLSGSAGQVFAISRNVVFKCPTAFDDPVPEQEEEMAESISRLENEKANYQILMKNRHPNIATAVLCVPEGIFLHRQEMTLESRINNSPKATPSPGTQERWIQQIYQCPSLA